MRLAISHEAVDGAGTWGEMSGGQRLALLFDSMNVGNELADEASARVRLAVRQHFGPDGPGDFFDATNVLLRELWREEHGGDASEWDANAAAAGKSLPPSAMDELVARKATMTAEQFEAAYMRLSAPETKVIGAAVWSGHVKREFDRLYQPVTVKWPRDMGEPEVIVAGRKVNARQRRRWVAMLAQNGVTRERVQDGIRSGAAGVSTAYTEE